MAKIDLNINIKLSNFLENFIEFNNRIVNHSDLSREDLTYWEDMIIVGDIVNDMTDDYNFCIDVIDFVLENFAQLKNIFNYTVEEMLDICPGLTIVNYKNIYDFLINKYGLIE